MEKKGKPNQSSREKLGTRDSEQVYKGGGESKIQKNREDKMTQRGQERKKVHFAQLTLC